MRLAGTILRTTSVCLHFPISLGSGGWQLGTPAQLCSMISRLLLSVPEELEWIFVFFFFLPIHHPTLILISGNFPTNIAFSTYGNKMDHPVSQAHAGNFAIPPTNRWSLCTPCICAWLCDLIWPMVHSQIWHKQRLEKHLSTGTYCCWEPCDHCAKKSGLPPLTSRGHMERQSVPVSCFWFPKDLSDH